MTSVASGGRMGWVSNGLFCVGLLGPLGCGPTDLQEAPSASHQALDERDAPAVARIHEPMRRLETSNGGRVYMTSIEETFPGSGSFDQEVFFFQPSATGQGFRIELSAKTSTGAVDTSHSFQDLTLTSHPADVSESQQTLPNASGQRVYVLPTSRAGWYGLHFTYAMPYPGRTLTIQVYDNAGKALPMAWSDPPGENVRVRAKLWADAPTRAYLKGGAYRSGDATLSAYADSVKVDGSLLYRRGFDQGQFNYPLGELGSGLHTVEFTLSTSSPHPTKFWFGINETSFDPNGIKTSWAPVQVLYYGATHTGDYDAWSQGVAFAQGPTLTAGVRPPPVRKGTTFPVALEHSGLNGQTATLRIYPLGSGTATGWPVTLSSKYTGGIFTTSGPSARYREQRLVSVPSNAPVGAYVLRATLPSGAQLGQDVLFYVLFDPYRSLGNGYSKLELETYGYDEDEDGANLYGDYGPDRDNRRDHFTTYYNGSAASGYTQQTKITGAFLRTGDASWFSLLDMAMAASQGTSTEFEAMRRLYRMVSQQLGYNRPSMRDDSSVTFLDGNAFLPSWASQYSRPGTEIDRPVSAQCFDYATVLVALARSAGVMARPVSSTGWLAGWANHAFTEAYIPSSSLPQHGGKVSSDPASANSDGDPWYAFDATDPSALHYDYHEWPVFSEAIAPRAQFGRTALALSGPGVVDAVTTRLNWNPMNTEVLEEASLLSVAPAYTSGPEFWLTQSGVSGWIGRGEKDVFRISKSLTGARAVKVRVLSTGADYLIPKLCISSVASSPALPTRCADAATTYNLPAGESYVAVFNDAPDVPGHRNLRGDSVHYALDLVY
jgi:transglutaminase superfamily protein